MQNVVLTAHLILAVALIIVVLLQRSEGGGLGIGGGGGGVMTGRGAATALSKLTWALGVAFVVTSVSLTVLAARSSGSNSVLDRLGVEAPTAEQPAPGTDLGAIPAPAPEAPPTTDGGPATPPPLE